MMFIYIFKYIKSTYGTDVVSAKVLVALFLMQTKMAKIISKRMSVFQCRNRIYIWICIGKAGSFTHHPKRNVCKRATEVKRFSSFTN